MRRWSWHPLLFAVYPVVYLFGRNCGDLSLDVLWRSLGVALALGVLVWILARRVAGDGSRGALLASGFLVLWSVYGHGHQVLAGAWFGQHRVLLPVWIGAVAWMLRSIRRGRPGEETARVLSKTAVMLGVGLLILPVGMSVLELMKTRDGNCGRCIALPAASIVHDPIPVCRDADIYHIVLDGYGRADVLADLYDLDNTPFLEALRGRGFCVVDSARANYTQTLPALAAAFGVRVEGHDREPPATDRGPLAARLKDALRSAELPSFRDWTRAFATGYAATELLASDRYLAPPTAINEFERALVAATPAGVALNLIESRWGDVLHRRTVEYAFSHLAVAPDAPPKAFTFAHIVAPHPPFVFAPPSATAGAMVPLADGDHVVHDGGLSIDQYRSAYRAQIEAVNSRFLRAVDEILANGRESIILVHGDHGPGSLLKWDERIPDPAAARERLGILLAVRFPAPGPDICAFARTPAGARQDIWLRMMGWRPVPDESPSRHSTWSNPFDFVEIAPDGTPVAP